MVNRKQKSNKPTKNVDNIDENNDGIVDDFVFKLTDALHKRHKRNWKAEEVELAVAAAVDALPPSEVKSALENRLTLIVDKLSQHLISESEEPPIKKAKKEVLQQNQHTTVTDDALDRAINSLLQSQPSSTVHSVDDIGIAALVARFPPPKASDLIAWHACRLAGIQYHNYSGCYAQPSSSPSPQKPSIDDLLQITEYSVHISSALSGHASDLDNAVSVFKTGVNSLKHAIEACTIPPRDTDDLQYTSWYEKICALSQEIITCIHLAMMEIKSKIVVRNGGKKGRGDWWLAQNPRLNLDTKDNDQNQGNTSLLSASTQCAEIIRVHELARSKLETATEKKKESLTNADVVMARAGPNIKLLAPFSVAGILENMAFRDLSSEDDIAAVTTDIGLYMAAAQQELPSAEFYFIKVAAARNASILAGASILNDRPLATRLLNEAASCHPPSGAIDWLRDQPPSSIILHALQSLRGGPPALSSHLVYQADDQGIKALSIAARAGGVLNAGGGESGDDVDALLFFVSKDGDGEQGFGLDWDDENEEDGEERMRRGIDIDDLPEDGKALAENDEEEESDVLID